MTRSHRAPSAPSPILLIRLCRRRTGAVVRLRTLVGAGVLWVALAGVWAHAAPNGDPARGGRLFRDRRCAVCHGAGGDVPATRVIPRLSGQSEAYLVQQLRAYSVVHRRGSNAEAMWSFATPLSDADIHDLAAYLAGVARAPRPKAGPTDGPAQPGSPAP